jgi:hypothetical protein
MKRYLTLSTVTVTTLAIASAGFGKPTPTRVAFRATAPANVGRHITAAPKGGLVLGSKVLGNKEVFTLLDMNGGTLQDGDSVQIQYASGKNASYWQENKGKLSRTGDRPGKTALFKVKWKQKNKSLMLQTPGGKFVSGTAKGKDLVTTSKQSDPTTVFELIKNPSPAKKPAAAKKSSAR